MTDAREKHKLSAIPRCRKCGSDETYFYHRPGVQDGHSFDPMSEPVASPQATRPHDDCDCPCEKCADGGEHCGKKPCDCAAQPAAGTTPAPVGHIVGEGGKCWCGEQHADYSATTHNAATCKDQHCSHPTCREGTTPQAERSDPKECKHLIADCAKCGTTILRKSTSTSYEARAVAPVETPQFTEIKPVGSHIIDHPDLKRWLEQEPRYAEQRRDGLWIHYTAICTLLKSYAAQNVAPVETPDAAKLMVTRGGEIHEECPDCRGECSPYKPTVETRLTAAEFWAEYWGVTTPDDVYATPVKTVCAFAEAFRDKSEAELRAKLAEQGKPTPDGGALVNPTAQQEEWIAAIERAECQIESFAPLTLTNIKALRAEAEAAALKRDYAHLDFLFTDLEEHANDLKCEAAALRERERKGLTFRDAGEG